ncbi:unnamed protein product [Meganyctiphanes norvegica]|uniref:Uncharacterized protein n=1 Tax=Meganyctiphanes norvegica TaxID=48144 RepID=A0AAV2RFC1_MEGNR
MGQQSLLALIFMVVILAIVHDVANAMTCYDCTDDIDLPNSGVYYDPDCGRYDYDGNTHTYDGDTCLTAVYDNGDVTRMLYGYGDSIEDGECIYWPGHTTCYCKTDNCNTQSYCEQCEQ